MIKLYKARAVLWVKRVTTRTRGKGLNSKNRLLNVCKNNSERKLLCADIKHHTQS